MENSFKLEMLESGIECRRAVGMNTNVLIDDQTMLSAVNLDPNSRRSFNSRLQRRWKVCPEGRCPHIQKCGHVTFMRSNYLHTPRNVEQMMRIGGQSMTSLDTFPQPRGQWEKPAA